jgi:protein O-GlcNAc transferase
MTKKPAYDEYIRRMNESQKVNVELGRAVHYHKSGQLRKAEDIYLRILQTNPTHTDALHLLGLIAQQLGDDAKALHLIQKAIENDPNNPTYHHDLGKVLQAEGKTNEAILHFRKAVQLEPDPGIEVEAALCLPVICESSDSIRHHRERILEQLEHLRKRRLVLEDPYKEVGSTSFHLAYHGLNNREIHEKIASFYIRSCTDLAWRPSDRDRQKNKGDKIKIGIISNFLYNHTIGNLARGIIEHLNRKKFYVEVFHIQTKEDHVSQAIDGSADQMVILPTELRGARHMVAEHSLDILLYLDIGMDPLTYFLAFSRLAPVQCVTWGHPDTTGIPNMDYFISSDFAEPPDAEAHYSERLIRLRRFIMYFQPPKIPDEAPSREEFGLPKDCNLYFCPQNLFKLHPDFDSILGQILRRDPRGLLVVSEGLHKHWAELLLDRFTHSFPEAVDRVRLIPRVPQTEFLSLLRIADTILDTPHFTGGYTSLLCFSCGIPVVTWPGRFMRGRLTLAFYHQIGIMDCVAGNAESYVNIALRLAKDRSWREEIKSKMRARAKALYEDIEAVCELERFFEWAVEGQHKSKFVS